MISAVPQWNSCAIDQAAFQERSQATHMVLQKISQLREQAEGASGKSEGEKLRIINSALKVRLDFAAYLRVPAKKSDLSDPSCPDEKRPGYVRPSTLGSPMLLAAEDPVPTGSHMTFQVTTSKPVYLYLFQRKNNGKIDAKSS